MDKLQQASVQGVPLKMLALLTTEQQEGRTLPLEQEATCTDLDPHWPNYPQRRNQLMATISATPPHHPLGGAWDDSFHGVGVGRSGSKSYV